MSDIVDDEVRTREIARNKLIIFGKDFFSREKRDLTIKDLEIYKISYQEIYRLFGGMQKFLTACDIVYTRRRSKMSDPELREYLKAIKVVLPNNKNCPSLYKLNTVCLNECNCWIINYAKHNNRQKITYKNRTERIYRLSYLLFIGDLPTGYNMVIAHKCDNSLCFNPEHLEMITQKQNMQDCVKRGRKTNQKAGRRKPHGLKDPYNYVELLAWLKKVVNITNKNEWLCGSNRYQSINIKGSRYLLHRLVLANKLGVSYEEIEITRHVFPNGDEAAKNDVNPDHLLNGTSKDNGNDSKNKWSLSEQNIAYVREELEKSSPFRRGEAKAFDLRISQELDVSEAIITKVRSNYRYKVYPGGKVYKGTKEKPILQLNHDGKVVARFNSARDAEAFGFTNSGISIVCNGKQKSHKGFRWMFEDDYFKLNSNLDIQSKSYILNNEVRFVDI